MANLRQARRRVYIILIVFLLVDIAAAIVLFTPLAGSGAARQKEFEDLRSQVQSKIRIVIPPDQVQTRVDTARGQLAGFYKERIPADASAISTQLGKLATGNKVRMLSVRYDEIDSDVPGLTRVHITANVAGDYVDAIRFINAVERSKLLFVIDNVSLGEQQGGNVRLAVTLETYLRGGA